MVSRAVTFLCSSGLYTTLLILNPVVKGRSRLCALGVSVFMMQSDIMIILGGSFGEASSIGQTEGFTFGLKLGGSDLPIFRYDVDHRTGVVWKLRDLLGARMPTHAVAFGLKFRDIDHSAIGLHVKGCGEGLPAIFVYHRCHLGQVIKDIFMP